MEKSKLKKKLPIGIDDFKKLRQEDFYYVDKTGFIGDLLNNWGKVNLFTRPRRFGKTLNMSMLKSFFEIGADKSLFDGLAISKDTALCDEYFGKYPVIFISLKGIDGLKYKDAYGALRKIIRAEISRFRLLLKSDFLEQDDKNILTSILQENDTPDDIRDSLRMLSSLLRQYYSQKVIILIDEYDVPLDKAFKNGYYKEMVALIRSLVRDHRFQPENDHRFQPVQMSSNLTNIQNAVDSIFVSLSYLRQYGSVAEVHLSDYLVLSSVRLACKVEAIGSVEKTVQYALRKN